MATLLTNLGNVGYFSYCSKETIPKLSDLNNKDLLLLIIWRGSWVLPLLVLPELTPSARGSAGLEAGLTHEPGSGCCCTQAPPFSPTSYPPTGRPVSSQAAGVSGGPGPRTLTMPLCLILLVKVSHKGSPSSGTGVGINSIS